MPKRSLHATAGTPASDPPPPFCCASQVATIAFTAAACTSHEDREVDSDWSGVAGMPEKPAAHPTRPPNTVEVGVVVGVVIGVAVALVVCVVVAVVLSHPPKSPYKNASVISLINPAMSAH